jgi:hypothetical protein
MQVRKSVVRTSSVLALALASASVVHAQAPSVNVSALIYTQYAYQLKNDSSATPVGKDNAFDVTRAYINVIGSLPNDITARITADIDGRKAATNQLTYRLKYAYVAYNPNKGPITFKLGAIHTAYVDYEEALYEYRFQGTIAQERAGYLSSSDFGAGIDGTFGYNKFDFQATALDGTNYNNTPDQRGKVLELRASYKILNTDLGGRAGGLRLTGFVRAGQPVGGGHTRRFLGELSYKSKAITVAASYMKTSDSVYTAAAGTTPANVGANLDGSVISAYAIEKVPHTPVAFIERVDLWDPNTNVETSTTLASGQVVGSTATNRETRVILGASYQLSPNVILLADLDLNSLRNGSPNNRFDATRDTLLFQSQIRF